MTDAAAVVGSEILSRTRRGATKQSAGAAIVNATSHDVGLLGAKQLPKLLPEWVSMTLRTLSVVVPECLPGHLDQWL